MGGHSSQPLQLLRWRHLSSRLIVRMIPFGGLIPDAQLVPILIVVGEHHELGVLPHTHHLPEPIYFIHAVTGHFEQLVPVFLNLTNQFVDLLHILAKLGAVLA
jgi:hypothetical protein